MKEKKTGYGKCPINEFCSDFWLYIIAHFVPYFYLPKLFFLIMEHILALEFDANHFTDSKSCIDWIKKSDIEYMARIQGFRLRLRKKCIFLTDETRKVWSWYNNLWKYPYLIMERPDTHVVIVKKTGTQSFVPVDIPEPLPDTVEQLQKRAEKKALSEEKAKQRKEKQKLKRKADREQNKLKKNKSVVPKTKKVKMEKNEEEEMEMLDEEIPLDLLN